jgi:hypothetical protein
VLQNPDTMLIGAKRKPEGHLVFVTHSAHQVRLVASAALSREMALGEFRFVAIDVHGSRVTLIFVNEPTYRGVDTHRLQNDGGKPTVARATFIGRALAGEYLPPGRYPAKKTAKNAVTFDTAQPSS